MRLLLVTTTALIVTVLALGIGGALAQGPGAWTYLYDGQHTGVAADPVQIPLSLSWRHASGQATEAVSTPAIGPGRVYFVVGSKLYAVERATGEQAWEIELNNRVHSALVLEEGTLYFGAADGKLWAVDATAGTAKWKYPSEGPIRSAPLIHDGVMYFGSDDKKVYAYDLATDSHLWQFPTGGEVQSTPAVWRDLIFVSSQDGYLYALKRASGAMAWHAQVSRGRNRSFASPVVHRDQVLLSAGNYLLGFDAQKGARRWSFAAGDLIAGSPAVRGRRAYVGSRDGVVYCIDTTRGKAVWRFPKQGSRGPIQSSPVLAGEALLVRSGGTVVTTQPTQTGTAYGRPGTTAGTTAQAQTTTIPTSVWAFAPDSGKLLWEYRLQQPLQPTIATGRQFLGYGPMGRDMPGVSGPPGPPGIPHPQARPSITTDMYSRSVDACVVTTGGSVYITGDDGALYGFAAGATDNEKPVFKETILMFPGPTPGTQYSFSVPTEAGELFFPPPPAEDIIQIPGAPPLSVSFGVDDSGSGIDPDSVQVLIDGQAVPEDQLFYDATQGRIWWHYEPQTVMARNYPAGTHIIEPQATDWHGNQAGCRIYLVVDNSLTAPKIPGMPEQPVGWPGGAMGGAGYAPGYAAPGGYPAGRPGEPPRF